MMKPEVALRLLAAACLLAGIAVAGGAMAKSGDMPGGANGAKVAAVAQPAAAPVEAAVTPKTVPAVREAMPPCARKVKVVYAGYGEADRAACATAAPRWTARMGAQQPGPQMTCSRGSATASNHDAPCLSAACASSLVM